MSFLPSFDGKLVGRVQKYMSEHHRVTPDLMAEELQQIYFKDYGRRKRNAFRKLVKQVHQGIISKERQMQGEKEPNLSKWHKPMDNRNHHSSSESENEEMLVEYSNENALNSSVMSLYKKKPRKSLSAPASPFSYIDSPSNPGDSIMRIQNENKDLNDDKRSVDVDEMEMTKARLNFNGDSSNRKKAKFQHVDESADSSKTVSSNMISDDNFLIANSTPVSEARVLNQKSSKKKKQVKTDKKDYEITGEKAQPKFDIKKSEVKFEDIGGNEKTLREVCKLLLHVKHPEIYKALGIVPPCGILLHGPPGCGKSLLANAIAGELDLPMMKIAATEIVSGVSGESEQKLRDMFEVAIASAPCVIFIDEIDAITPKRELASKDMERRIVAQLLACLDDLSKSASQILVIGATNRPDSIDPALRRAGRFDKEISMGIPDEKARQDILRLTPGYVGADLMSLCREAAMSAVNRILMALKKENISNVEQLSSSQDLTSSENIENSESPPENKTSTESENESTAISLNTALSSTDLLHWLRQSSPLSESQLQSLCISFLDFEQSLPVVQPSAKREGFATVPDVTWDDIGALEDIRDELTVAILAPVRNPDAFSALGLTKPPGILLAGPPGCGKTLLAKAIANESGINFISVKGPELLNMYVGESERAVRQCFERARNSSPCVVFFDELDSLCPRRSGAESASTARVVNQMLTEMDGLETRGHVFVMAATNRPDIIDPAVLRPGRLDKTLYVGLPNANDRVKILRTLTRNGTKPPISRSVTLENIAEDSRCDRFTGADLSSLVREAAVNALREHISSNHVLCKDSSIKKFNVEILPEHFEKAFKKVKPSVSTSDELRYEKMKINLDIT